MQLQEFFHGQIAATLLASRPEIAFCSEIYLLDTGGTSIFGSSEDVSLWVFVTVRDITNSLVLFVWLYLDDKFMYM